MHLQRQLGRLDALGGSLDRRHPRDGEDPRAALEFGEQRARRAFVDGTVEQMLDRHQQAVRQQVRLAAPGRAVPPSERRSAAGIAEDDEVDRPDLAGRVADVAVEPLPVIGLDRGIGLVPDRVVLDQRQHPRAERGDAAPHQALGGLQRKLVVLARNPEDARQHHQDQDGDTRGVQSDQTVRQPHHAVSVPFRMCSVARHQNHPPAARRLPGPALAATRSTSSREKAPAEQSVNRQSPAVYA